MKNKRIQWYLLALVPQSVPAFAIASPLQEDHVQQVRECLLSEKPHGGWVLVDGDILVPPIQMSNFTTNLWSGGVIRYFFEASVGTANRQRMRSAMDRWETEANLVFVESDAHSLEHIHVIDSNNDPDCDGNHSGVGAPIIYTGGATGYEVCIQDWTVPGILWHELGHTLGYWHEQSRTDRDSYVQVNLTNVCQDCCEGTSCNHNFEIRPESLAYGPYDFDSIMHYDDLTFSDNGLPTITVLTPNEGQQDHIGQQDHLSFWDSRTMSFLYPESNWRFVDRNFSGTQSGTFLNPYRILSSGISAVPTAGKIWMQPGNYANTGLFTKAMTWAAPLGGVVIGRP